MATTVCIHCGHPDEQHTQATAQCMKNPDAEVFDRELLPTYYTPEVPRRRRYRFSLGDSQVKGIGICFDVEATEESQAVEGANDFVSEMVAGWDAGMCGKADMISVNAGPYLKLTTEDIVDVYDEEDETGS